MQRGGAPGPGGPTAAAGRARISIPGVRVGHWSDARAMTGCTLIELPEGSVGSYEVRGGAPATRELDVLHPQKTVARVDGVLLTGGSAFGLAAADGVVRWMEEQGRGVPTPAGSVPIVPALGLFDLALGESSIRPDAQAGYRAASSAAAEFEVGPVGAGTGARSSQWRGPGQAHRAGLGFAEHRLGQLRVAAICAVNALGDIRQESDPPSFSAAEAFAALASGPLPRTHTTIGVVITNAQLDKVGCKVVAEGGHDGLARAVFPPHTRMDGDALIAVATGQVSAPVDTVRMLANAAVADAIRSRG